MMVLEHANNLEPFVKACDSYSARDRFWVDMSVIPENKYLR